MTIRGLSRPSSALPAHHCWPAPDPPGREVHNALSDTLLAPDPHRPRTTSGENPDTTNSNQLLNIDQPFEAFRDVEEGVITAKGVLDLCLRGLERTNARLRDRVEERNDFERVERMADIQRRNFEVMAALQKARDLAVSKATETQERLRALLVREEVDR